MGKIYTEAVYLEQVDGSVLWEGRVYDTSRPGGPVDTQEGIAKDRPAAVIAVKAWSVGELASRQERETVTFTSSDVGILDFKKFGLS